jgi:predicted ATPase
MFTRGIQLFDQQPHVQSGLRFGYDSRVGCLTRLGVTLWILGYPDQAREIAREGIALARELSHPSTLAPALMFTANLHHLRGEECEVIELTEALIALSEQYGFAFFGAAGTMFQGRALTELGRGEEGVEQIHQGLKRHRATGGGAARSVYFLLLVDSYRRLQRPEEGLAVLADLLAVEREEHINDAEIYRLKGELTLQQERQGAVGNGQQAGETDARSLMPDAQGVTEACFLRAIAIAQKQHAKSLELRATVSLARLWQQQGKKTEAHHMLSEVYTWFTEGFDTKDLQEAKALLTTLNDEIAAASA